MLRGVNKQIVEVNQTNSPYFEKIYFIVKPGFCNYSFEQLESEAEKLASDIGITKPKNHKRRLFLFALTGVIAGALAALLLMALL